MSSAAVLTALVLVLVAAPAQAVEPAQLPPGGRVMLAADAVERFRLGGGPDVVRGELVAAPEVPGGRAWRVQTLSRPESPWNAQLVAQAEGPLRAADICHLSFFLRTVESETESGEGRTSAHVQRNHQPWEKLGSIAATAGREWRRLDMPFRPGRDLDAGEVSVNLWFGFRPQTVEVAGVQLVNFGDAVALADLPRTRQSYPGRENDAPWRAAAAERIERLRKGDLQVRVVDANGRAVEGARVRVAMQRHAFRFGAAVKARMICAEGPDGDRYRATVEANYNTIVFENDLKPRFWDLARSNENRNWRREWTDRAIAWLEERDIHIRGHYMIWGPLAEKAERYEGRPDDLRRDTVAHVRERVEAVGEHVDEWDAINHIAGWGTTYEDFFGSPAFYADIIRLGRELVPHADLWINEGQVLPSGRRRDDYERLARYLVEQGATPDGIGFMGHFGAAAPTPPSELLRVFDRFASIVPRLQLTEFDVNTKDEELQADYLRDVMIAAFSHPNFEAIVMWGFWEGAFWRPDAALYRRDWSLKPSGRAWLDLVKDQWWTDEQATTDGDGVARVRAFLGDYEVTASAGGRQGTSRVTLGRPGTEVTVRLD